MGKKIIGIYKITNKINNKVYIGQSVDLMLRKRQHFNGLKLGSHDNTHLQRSYDKYGKDNFLFEVIEITDDLDNKELHFINEYGGINSNLNYNQQDPITNKYSNYSRVERKKNMTGKTMEHKFGKEKSDIIKQKIAKSIRGRKYDEEFKDKKRGKNNPNASPVIDLKTGVIYNTVKEASEILGINKGTLLNWLNGINPNHTTLVFFYEADREKANNRAKLREISYTDINKRKPKLVINTITGVLYKTIGSAAKAHNINRQTLSSWLNGKSANNSNLVFI